MRALVAARGAGRADRARLGGHRRVARRQPARRARDAPRPGARHRARGPRAAGARRRTSTDFDLLLAMDRANLADLQRSRRASASAQKVAPAARVRPGERGRGRPRRAGPLLRRRTDGFEEVLDLVQAACAGLLEQIRARRGAVTLPAGLHRRAERDRRRRHQRGVPRRRCADGREAFVKTREDAAAGRVRRRGAGPRVAGRARRAADAARARARRALPRARVGGAGPPRRRGRRRSSARGLAATHAAGASCFGDPLARQATARRSCCFGPLRLPNEPAPDWPRFYARAAPAAARADRPRSRRALAAAARRRSSVSASACASCAGPPSRPRGCTATSGRGNVMADARRAPVADRPVRLRRAPRGRPRDARAVRARPTRSCSPPTREHVAAGRGLGASASSSTSCCRCSCTRCCSAAPTAPRPRASRAATPADRWAARPPGRTRSESGTCDRRP